jgi:toxin YxiD
LLESSSGLNHAKISAKQRVRRRTEGFNTTIQYEFNVGYREMIDSGVNVKSARKAIRRAYKYFDSIDAFR